jgi:hypothetical protein
MTNEKKKDIVQELIALSEQMATLRKGNDGQIFLIFHDEPHLAKPIKGVDSEGINRICLEHFKFTNRWPSQTARISLINYLSARGSKSKPCQTNLRVGGNKSTIFIDPVWEDPNMLLKVNADGYEATTQGEVVFTRTQISNALPVPIEGTHTVRDLWRFIRREERALPALIGALVTALMVDAPQPIVFLKGSANSGKTTALKFLMDLFDPTTSAPGTSLTQDQKELKTIASLRRSLNFDNISHVGADESDMLARISTGGEIIMRELYSDDNAHVRQFKRPVFVNGIMDGFSRSDLASRSIAFELRPLSSQDISPSTEINEEWDSVKAEIFHSFLVMASQILKNKGTVKVPEGVEHRNRELVENIAIASSILGLDGIGYLQNSIKELSETVLGSSVFADAVRGLSVCLLSGKGKCRHIETSTVLADELIEGHLTGKWMSSVELHEIIKVHVQGEDHKTFPQTSSAFGNALNRIGADLLTLLGITFTKKRGNKGYRYLIQVQEQNELHSVA